MKEARWRTHSSQRASPLGCERERSEVESQRRDKIRFFGCAAVWLPSMACHATSFWGFHFGLVMPSFAVFLSLRLICLPVAQFGSNISTLECGINLWLMTSAAHLIFSFIPHRLPSFKYSKYQTVKKLKKTHQWSGEVSHLFICYFDLGHQIRFRLLRECLRLTSYSVYVHAEKAV